MFDSNTVGDPGYVGVVHPDPIAHHLMMLILHSPSQMGHLTC